MPADKDVIYSAIDFWNKLYEASEAKVKFTKKSDGTIRIMHCTLDFKKIPKEKQPKTVNVARILKLMKESGIIHVFDLEKEEWRSVPFLNVDWLEIEDKRYKIRPPANKKGGIIPFKGKGA
jgi:hypothetical protein